MKDGSVDKRLEGWVDGLARRWKNGWRGGRDADIQIARNYPRGSHIYLCLLFPNLLCSFLDRREGRRYRSCESLPKILALPKYANYNVTVNHRTKLVLTSWRMENSWLFHYQHTIYLRGCSMSSPHL